LGDRPVWSKSYALKQRCPQVLCSGDPRGKAVTAPGERLCKEGREGRRVWLLAILPASSSAPAQGWLCHAVCQGRELVLGCNREGWHRQGVCHGPRTQGVCLVFTSGRFLHHCSVYRQDTRAVWSLRTVQALGFPTTASSKKHCSGWLTWVMDGWHLPTCLCLEQGTSLEQSSSWHMGVRPGLRVKIPK